MDLVAGCRAFVGVGDRGSFTLGAAAVGIPQPVASRRVAALERHVGGTLFDRTGHGAVLTAFGRELLPSARRLVDLADAVVVDAERARRRPLRLALPQQIPTAELARLVAAGRRAGTTLEPVGAGPAERTELVRRADVRASLEAVPSDQGSWTVPLGLAGTGRRPPATIHLDSLRVGRRSQPGPVLRLGPEDDVPHVRDVVVRAAEATALSPAQVVVSTSAALAAAEVLLGRDLLLCSRREAVELGLEWAPVAGLPLARGYRVQAGLAEDVRLLREDLTAALTRLLGGGTS